jgi:hypothetical protein
MLNYYSKLRRLGSVSGNHFRKAAQAAKRKKRRVKRERV